MLTLAWRTPGLCLPGPVLGRSLPSPVALMTQPRWQVAGRSHSLGLRCARGLPRGLGRRACPYSCDTGSCVSCVPVCGVCDTVCDCALPPHVGACTESRVSLCVCDRAVCRCLCVWVCSSACLEPGGDREGEAWTAWGVRDPRNARRGLESPSLLGDPLFVERSRTHA